LTDPRSKVTTWTYNSDGTLWKKKYHGQAFDNIVYTYNAVGKLATRRFYSSVSTFVQTAYTYDDAGSWVVEQSTTMTGRPLT